MTKIFHTHLSSTHSTNSQLIERICQNFEQRNNLFDYRQPHLLTADTQTGGRGQHGRIWQSPIGNVYLSLYLPSAEFSDNTDDVLKQRLDGRLSLCVGYQLSQIPVIASLQTIGVKWVNDIGFYQDVDAKQQFQKLAGILIEPVTIEGKLLGVVIGVGMNIGFAPTLTTHTQAGLNYQAFCLQDVSQEKLHVYEFYLPIQTAILQAVEQFNGFNASCKVAEFVQKFSQVDILLGKNLQITLPTSEIIMGKAQGIDGNGSLQILQNDGTMARVWTGTLQVIG